MSVGRRSQGVLTVNLVWASSTHHDRGCNGGGEGEKQVRTTVRVARTLPVKLLLPGGEVVDRSHRGRVSRRSCCSADALRRLERGDTAPHQPISLGKDEYTFPVVTAMSSGSLLRLRFGDTRYRETGDVDACYLRPRGLLAKVAIGQLRAGSATAESASNYAVALRGIGAALWSFVPSAKEQKN